MNISVKRVVYFSTFWQSVAYLIIISFYSLNGASHVINSVPQKISILTISDALSQLRKVMRNFPDNGENEQLYEKQQSGVLVACAKVLSENARIQIMDILQEIASRISYWQEQKNHQLRYFLTKNPLKWVMGKSQKEEIEHNLELLQSYQGEFYVLLGQLAKLDNVYDYQQKTIFVNDYTKGYVWIDNVLNVLSRIKVDIEDNNEKSPFIARVMLLRLKLGKVRRFKNDILLEMTDTQIPAHFERNWLKYGALMFLFGKGYSHADTIRDYALTSFGRTTDYVIDVAKDVKQMFFPGGTGRNGLVFQQNNIVAARSAMNKFLDNLEKDKVITAIEKKIVVDDEARGSSAALQNLINTKIMSSNKNVIYYAAEGWAIFGQLFSLHGGVNIEQEIAGLRNLALLAPAALVGWAGYRGLSAVYQKFVAKDYSQIRRELLDINSIFVDQTRPLDDEGYGKMIYLVYNLKQRAEREVPLNTRTDFIDDLERIELQEYDVAAKRRIVEDMFKKYSFLRLV